MAEQNNVEQRLSALENEVLELKRQLQTSKTPANWLERIAGSMEEFPEFQEVIRYGQELRRAEQPQDNKPIA